jgi:hypothetical protein
MVRSLVLSWEPDGYSDADQEGPMVMIRFLSSGFAGIGCGQKNSGDGKKKTD